MFIIDDIISSVVDMGVVALKDKRIENIQRNEIDKTLKTFMDSQFKSTFEYLNLDDEIDFYALSEYIKKTAIDEIVNYLLCVDDRKTIESKLNSVKAKAKEYARADKKAKEVVVEKFIVDSVGIIKEFYIANKMDDGQKLTARVIMDNAVINMEEIKQHNTNLHSETLTQMSEMNENLLKRITEVITNKSPQAEQLPSEDIYLGYNRRIKIIIEECQDADSFKKALNELNAVVQDIIDDVDSFSTDNRKKILLYLYDTIAQYHANTGDLDEATKIINRAETYVSRPEKDEYKRHYFIKAYILTQFQDKSKYNDIISLLNKAIEIDKSYHNAVFLKSDMEALAFSKSFEEQISTLELHYENFIKTSSPIDNIIIANYHQALGVIYKQHQQYEKAVEMLQKANDTLSSAATTANLAIAYYGWAIEGNPVGATLYRPKIDYPKMIKSFNLMSAILNEPQKHEKNLLRVLTPFYVSALHFCGQTSSIVQFSNYVDLSEADYETVRSIIIGKIITGKVKEHEIELLSIKDKALYYMGNELEVGNIDRAIEILEEAIDSSESDFDDLHHRLLELYLENNDIDKYKFCLEKMKLIGIEDVYSDWHSALIAEKDGDIPKACLLVSECLNATLSTFLIVKIKDFYIRNQLNDEMVLFYEKIHTLICNDNLRFDCLSYIYKCAIYFFVNHDYSLAKKIYNEIPREIIDETEYILMSVAINWKINNHSSLINDYGRLYEIGNDIKHKLAQAQSYKAICDYNNAEKAISEVLKRNGLSNDEKSMCLMFLYEIYLFKDEYEKSYDCIKEAAELNEHIPTHPSHAKLFFASMRCDKSKEGFPKAISHKNKHPNVTDWIEIIELPKGEDGEVNPHELIAKIQEKTGGTSETTHFNDCLDLYKQHRFSIYHLSEIRHSNFCTVLSWHEAYNLKMRLFSGDIEKLIKEANSFGKNIVVDSLTMMMLSKLGLLYLLKYFEQIYITSSSVERLQGEFLYGSTLGKEMISYEAYKFVEQSKQIVIVPDTPSMCENAEQLFLPKYLYDSIIYSIETETPFLYADEMLLYIIPRYIGLNVMLSIPALLRKHNEVDKLQSSKDRYKLLSNDYQFINFDCDDIYNHLQLNNFNLSKSNIEPFFCCKSKDDMLSFGNVYGTLLMQLLNENRRQCAIDFTLYTLAFLDKTEKRSKFYFDGTTTPCKVYMARYMKMREFVLYTLTFFEEILAHKGEPYSKIIEEYDFKHISLKTIKDIKNKVMIEAKKRQKS